MRRTDPALSSTPVRSSERDVPFGNELRRSGHGGHAAAAWPPPRGWTGTSEQKRSSAGSALNGPQVEPGLDIERIHQVVTALGAGHATAGRWLA